MPYEFVNIFDIEPKESSDDIFEYLKRKYAHYNPCVENDEFYIKLKNKVKVRVTKREPSEYSCEELRNGFYSVGVDGKDWGCSCPETDFKKACDRFSYLIAQGLARKE